MAYKEDRSSLGYLGAAYQYNLVKEFVEDKEYFKRLSPIIDQNVFTEPVLKSIVTIMRDHYAKFGAVPSYDTLKTYLGEQSHSNSERDINNAIIDKLSTMATDSSEFVKSKATKFFKQQNLVKAAHQILEIAGNGDDSKYELCEEIVHKALSSGNEEQHLFRVFDDYEDTLSKDYRCTIPTGISKLDEALEGGLGKGELATIIGPSGYGKALAVSELVATPDGWKQMGDIKLGDYVLGRDGKPTKVIGVYPQGVRPIYKVTFSDGVSCRCDLEHLWSVNTRYQFARRKYIAGLSNITGKRYAKKDLSFKTMSLKDIVQKGIMSGKNYKFRIPYAQAVEYNHRDVLISPYLMGYMIGDGSFSRREITVGQTDKKELVDLLKEYGNFTFKLKDNKDRASSIVYHVDFKNALSTYFDLNTVSDGKFIPKDYKYNDKESRILLLNGLMDSDGTCSKNGQSTYSTKSKQLATDVKELVLSLGGYASITQKKTSYYSKKYNKRVNCGISYSVNISLCDNTIPVFKLKRKQERVSYRTKYSNNRFIKSVEYDGEEYAQCIMVDAEDSLYLTRDFIVTHNTSMTTGIASFAATYKCEQNNNKGFKVLQIVFEDKVKQLRRKHFSRVSEVEARKLSHDEEIFKVREATDLKNERCQMIQNNILLGHYASGEITANDVRNIIKNCINDGFKPDLLILDYFECLKLLKSGFDNDRWDAEGTTMRRLETIADEFDVGMWVPIQGTKDSLSADIVTMENGGGSFKKLQIAHINVSITRSLEDLANNIAKIAVLKNRAGKSGTVFNNVYMNNGTCTINTDTSQECSDIIKYNETRVEEQNNMAQRIFLQHMAKRKANVDEAF